MDRLDTRFVKVADRDCGGGLLGSLGMFYKVIDHKKVYDAFERPPFPIIIERPTLRDVLRNYRL